VKHDCEGELKPAKDFYIHAGQCTRQEVLVALTTIFNYAKEVRDIGEVVTCYISKRCSPITNNEK